MKKLVVAALTVAAISANIAFAEDDDGIVSAAPAIADPVNPQQGMLASAYHIQDGRFEAVVAKLSTAPSIKNYVDKSNDFGRKAIEREKKITIIKWEGFIKCKRAGVYSFSFDGKSVNGSGDYCFALNGIDLIKSASGQETVAGKLKLGWNKVTIVYEAWNESSVLKLRYKPNSSMSEPRLLSPAMMFYDMKPEEEW